MELLVASSKLLCHTWPRETSCVNWPLPAATYAVDSTVQWTALLLECQFDGEPLHNMCTSNAM